MKEEIAEALSQKVDKEQAINLINSYEALKNAYAIGDYEASLSKSGKFVEHVFIVLEYLLSRKKIKEVTNIGDIKKRLEKCPKESLPESVRILIPRIATSMPYDLRSKRGAVHVKEVSPTEVDAFLTISACDWIIAEFMRLYSKEEERAILSMMRNIVERKFPVLEKIAGHNIILRTDLSCKDEILILLYCIGESISNTEFFKSLKGRSSALILTSINNAEKEKLLVRDTEGRCHLTRKGTLHIEKNRSDKLII